MPGSLKAENSDGWQKALKLELTTNLPPSRFSSCFVLIRELAKTPGTSPRIQMYEKKEYIKISAVRLHV